MAIIPQNVYYGTKTKYLNKFKVDYQGTVATVSDLPEGDIPKGTVYNVEANGSNYLWNGEEWDELGSDDSNIVHKTGNEVINGAKTFTSEPKYNNITISGKNSNYCSDCNAVLTPGNYYFDEDSLNTPSTNKGLLFVYGVGGDNDKVIQIAICRNAGDTTYDIEFCRAVTVVSGVFSSATTWSSQNYIPNNRGPLFRVDGSNLLVLSPPHAGKPNTVASSTYSHMWFMHPRDASRDSNRDSFWYLARGCDNTSPQSATKCSTKLLFGAQEGGIPVINFVFETKANCFSDVVYTDSTSESIRGEFIKAGDTVNDKIVNSVTYSKDIDVFAFYAFQDNLLTLGTATYRVADIYAVNGSINTSDERLKEAIDLVPNDVLDAWNDISWIQYQFKDSVAKKGNNARIHAGLVAQQIDSTFKKHNLDISKYGLFCYDSWDDEFDENEEGEVVQTKKAGDRYSLRYEEALAMEAAYQRRRADRAEARIKALEDRLEALEAKLG